MENVVVKSGNFCEDAVEGVNSAASAAYLNQSIHQTARSVAALTRHAWVDRGDEGRSMQFLKTDCNIVLNSALIQDEV
ncbi:MAG: hypothetical protein JRD69_08920 [Deltaproteobacteria bacterium]|nr:hypothetical protein [Deltaproteobacteria bacterium]